MQHNLLSKKWTLGITTTTLIFFQVGCSTLGPRPQRNSPPPAHVISYNSAMADLKKNKKDQACQSLAQLSSQEHSLKNLAALKLELLCADLYPQHSVDLKNVPHWYSNLTKEIQKNRKVQTSAPLKQATPKTWQDQLSQLRKQRDFKGAIELLQKRIALTQSEEDQYQLYKTLRQVYKTAQNRKAYLETGDFLLESAKKSFDKDPQNPENARRLNEAYSLVSKAYWTDNFLEKAQLVLTEASTKLKNHYSLQEPLYLLGAIAKEQKDLEAANQYFQQALAEKQVSPDIELRLLWAEAWLLNKLNKSAEARPLFQKYASLHPDNLEKFRGLFWAAQMIRSSQPSIFQEELEQISKKDSLGFYGLISFRELNQPIPPAFDDSSATSVTNAKDLELIQEAQDLMGIQEYSASSKLINHLQIRINRYTLFAQNPEMVFPILYKNEIQSAANKAQISPELIFSIIRQESGFDPEARSHADALGLMQLLPSVAEVTAKEHKLDYKEAFDLLDPSKNIPIGAFELQKLMKTYKSNFILAVARYNASEDAVQGWLKVRYSANPLEFIEEIGYDETRNYVKLVMRNHLTYQRLSAQKSFAFPEELLRWDYYSPEVSSKP